MSTPVFVTRPELYSHEKGNRYDEHITTMVEQGKHSRTDFELLEEDCNENSSSNKGQFEPHSSQPMLVHKNCCIIFFKSFIKTSSLLHECLIYRKTFQVSEITKVIDCHVASYQISNRESVCVWGGGGVREEIC